MKQSLAIRQEIGDKSGEAITFNNISQIHNALGDLEKAQKFLQKSLIIRQQIGDVRGQCITLFNIGDMHLQNKQIEQAKQIWLKVYKQAKKMQLAKLLDALDKRADQLGLKGGLDAWEQLAQQMNQQDLDED